MAKDEFNHLMAMFERTGPALYALLVRLTLREDVAEDLMQELFMKLSGHMLIKRVKDLDAYAYRSAINLAFSWRKKQFREGVCLHDIEEPIAKSCSPLRDVMAEEELEQVLDAVGKLQDVSREVFVRRHIQQESYEDIAAYVGTNVHHTRMICHRAMIEIRQMLGDNKAVFEGGANCEEA